MVFQNYALYPHMTAYKNMAFGLKMRRTPKAEIDRKVREVAALLGLERLLDRKPAALSGGECQRVAVGRAIVRDPKVFLFDEPLSNLDAKLRLQMRTEIKTLQRKLRATMIYVTHDQEEAMTLGDTLVIMRAGRIQQRGAPLDVYRNPANRFVAEFIGTPTINILQGRLQETSGDLTFAGREFEFKLSASLRAAVEPHTGVEVVMGMRPEHCHIIARGDTDRKSSTTSMDLPCRIDVLEQLGDSMLVYVAGPGGVSLVARADPSADYAAGDNVILRFDPMAAHFFGSSGERLN
jgi:multiple sugar transport system ATP-binding protein